MLQPFLLYIVLFVVALGITVDVRANDSAITAELAVTEIPSVEGTPETRSLPFLAWPQANSSTHAYVEREYLVSGKAQLYGSGASTAKKSIRSTLEVLKPPVPYTTRMLVRHPRVSGDNQPVFNGTVYLEILNPTAGWDGDPIWNNTYSHIQRGGAAWVGVTSKPVTVEFLKSRWGEPPFAKRNNERYQDLSMPHFGQIWDVLAQVGRLLKEAGNPANPLAHLNVERVILVGYSQSVAYQITFANNFHESTRASDGSPVFDGYFVAAGGVAAKKLNLVGATIADYKDESLTFSDPRNVIAVDAPVIRFQTQTEVDSEPFGKTYTARQDETEYPLIRTYELAGGAHVDVHTSRVSGVVLSRDLGLPSFSNGCDLPINPVPIGLVQSALLDALDLWIRDGKAPPASRLLTLDGEPDASLALDNDGNALGGVRLPHVEVPRGTYLAANSGSGFCFLIGGYQAFSAEELVTRYRTTKRFQRRFRRALQKSVREGFILPADAASLRAELKQIKISN